MKNIFPISTSEALYLLAGMRQSLPFVEKIQALYFDTTAGKMAGLVWESGQPEAVPVVFSDDYDFAELERWRKGKARVSWHNERELPFDERRDTGIQKEVFSEVDNSVLLVRLNNAHDRLRDLYFFYFNSDYTNFGLTAGHSVLDTNSKTMIARMVEAMLINLRRNRQERIEDFRQYKTYLSRMRDKLKLNALKEDKQSESVGNMRLEFARYVLEKNKKQRGIRLVLSSAAEELVKATALLPEAAEEWINKAVEFAFFSDYEPENPLLIIEDWHFPEVSYAVEQQPADSGDEEPETRYQRSYALLNRLEKAAARVLTEHDKLTGSLVGLAMEPAISAPAITDALKKHGRKIVSLMQLYPRRWPIIRSHFKPLVNVLENRAYRKAESA